MNKTDRHSGYYALKLSMVSVIVKRSNLIMTLEMPRLMVFPKHQDAATS